MVYKESNSYPILLSVLNKDDLMTALTEMNVFVSQLLYC